MITAGRRPRARALLVAAFVMGILGTSVVDVQSVPILTPVPQQIVPNPFISGHANLYAWGAATLPNGNVLIGDYRNYNVAVFKPDGTTLPRVMNNQGFAPYGLGVDPNTGDMYLADTERRQIRKFNSAGKFVLRWGKLGGGVGKFQYPSRVSVGSDGRVYVNDTWENQVVVHTPTGTELFTFGSFGTADGQWKQPHGMAFDYGQPDVPGMPSDDRLFVADASNFRIQVFDTEGRFLYKFGSKGIGPGQFGGDLRGVAIDQVNDWVYVVDAGANKVRKYTLAGTHLKSWGSKGEGPGQFIDGGREIAVDGVGNVWVSDMPNHRVQVFNPNGDYLFERPSPPVPPADGGFNGPRGVAVDKFGNLFVTDTYNQRIQKFSADGTFITKWGERGNGPYSFNYPRMLATDPRDGSVVVADTDNEVIKKYTGDGVLVWARGGPKSGSTLGMFRNPHGVDVGPDGRVYVADTRNNRVQVLREDGVPLYAFGVKGTGPGQMTFPRGIALDPSDQSIWVADASGRDVVHHFENDGDYLGKLGETGLLDHQLKNPFDVEVDADFVYVADTQSNKIKVFDKTTGASVIAFGGTGTTLGKMVQPQGLDLGPNGTLYVMELGTERIQKWSLGLLPGP